jgi:hypothetical protein
MIILKLKEKEEESYKKTYKTTNTLFLKMRNKILKIHKDTS